VKVSCHFTELWQCQFVIKQVARVMLALARMAAEDGSFSNIRQLAPVCIVCRIKCSVRQDHAGLSPEQRGDRFIQRPHQDMRKNEYLTLTDWYKYDHLQFCPVITSLLSITHVYLPICWTYDIFNVGYRMCVTLIVWPLEHHVQRPWSSGLASLWNSWMMMIMMTTISTGISGLTYNVEIWPN